MFEYIVKSTMCRLLWADCSGRSSYLCLQMNCFQIYIQMEIRGVDLISHLYIFPSYIGGVCLPLKSAASGLIRIYKLKAHIHTVCKKLFMHIFSIFFFLAFHHSFFSHSYHKDHSPSARKVFTTYSSHIIF